jgi:hypothetical protein
MEGKINKEDKEKIQKKVLTAHQRNKAATESADLKDIYLPKHLGLFDFSDADKKRYTMNVSASMRDLYIHHQCDKISKGKEMAYTYKEFREANLLFNSLLTKKITEEAYWYKLPFGLGVFGISKFKGRYFKPRFVKEGVELYTNPHSEGFIAKFSWIKDKAFLATKSLFRHCTVANTKQSIAHAIFNLGACDKYAEISRESELLTRSQTRKLKENVKRAERIGQTIEEYVVAEKAKDKIKKNTATKQ